MSKAYVDQNYPLWLVEALRGTDETTEDERLWSSQPRPFDSTAKETLVVNFREPASIGQVSLEVRSRGCEMELFYVNRSGKRVPVLDRSLRPIRRSFADSERGWTPFDLHVYPLVATRFEIQFRRTQPPSTGGINLSTTIQARNLLLKRNVFVRDDTMLGFERDVDPLGNYITKSVKDWDPEKAGDGKDFTYWMSEPQPTPEAVVAFYADVRDENGADQHIDRFWLDPLYADQHLNVYYSSDETEGTRRLSRTKARNWGHTKDAVWKRGVGLELTDSTSDYTINVFPYAIPHRRGNWHGVEWIPYFDSASPGFTGTLTLMDHQANSTKVEYNPTTRTIKVTIQRLDSSYVSVTSAPLTFSANQTVRWVAKVGKTELAIYTKVGNGQVAKKAVPIDGSLNLWTERYLHFYNLEGRMTVYAMKVTDSTDEHIKGFLQDPALYITPDPVLEDETGTLPSTTLDNVIIGGDWRLTELIYGGLDSSFFESKVWTPIWRDWVTRTGYFYLPHPVQARYMKFELTNLTERPYPVYDQSLETSYQTFPVSVKMTAQQIADTITTKKTTTTTTTTNTTVDVSRDGVHQSRTNTTDRSVQQSIAESSTTNTTDVAPLYEIHVGNGSVNAFPRMFDEALSRTFQTEVADRLITKSTDLSQSTTQSTYTKTTDTRQTVTDYVAHDAYYTVVRGDWLIKIGSRYDVEWRTIYEANKKLIDSNPWIPLLPKRSEGWWIFPGQQLRIPGGIMEEVTRTVGHVERRKTNTVTQVVTRNDTSVTGRTVTNTTRERFTNTSVHRYEKKAVHRDVALAYFTGLREIKVFRANWSAEKDDPEYQIMGFAPTDFAFHGVKADEYNTLRRDPAVTAPLNGHAPGHVTSAVYPSLSNFDRVEVEANARPFTERRVDRRAGVDLILEQDANAAGMGLTRTNLVQATPAGPGMYSVKANPLYHASLVEVSPGMWTIRDTSLGRGEFQRDILFQGSPAQRLVRTVGSLPVSMSSVTFPADNLSVGYAEVSYYAERMDPAARLKLTVARDGTELFSEEITDPAVGRWATYRTRLEKPAGDLSELTVTLSIVGTGPAEVYVGKLTYNFSTIYYYVSNDGGSTWHDATTVVNRPNTGYVFPKLGNKLRFRAQLLGSGDYIYGLKIRPRYLPEA